MNILLELRMRMNKGGIWMEYGIWGFGIRDTYSVIEIRCLTNGSDVVASNRVESRRVAYFQLIRGLDGLEGRGV